MPAAEIAVDPKGDKKPEESTMDFAANIEKVKEVRILRTHHIKQTLYRLFYHSFLVWLVLGSDF